MEIAVEPRARGDNLIDFRNRLRRWFEHRMRIYEASIRYELVQLGEAVVLDRADLVVEYIKSAFETYPTQESFWVVLLDRKNHPIGRVMVSLGTLTSTLVHPREVLRPAILASAAAIIVAHNHPSGDPAPSSADIRITRQLREACQLIDIALLDHVVVGQPEGDPTGSGFYSFRAAGLL
jgi:DNA repair protein RadC